MSTAFTFYFEEIFPNYESWVNFMNEYADFIDYENEIESNFDKFCYSILARHFTHQNIRYDNPHSFKAELLLVYQTKFRQFLKQKEILDELYKLTKEEIIELNKSIANYANNPNDTIDDPTKPLNFISNQTYSILEGNKLENYLKALEKIPTLNIFNFIYPQDDIEVGFIDLFMNVQPNIEYFYKKGE